MDVSVRASLRERLLKYSNMYGLDELVPTGEGQQTYEQEGWGFLRTWGWKAQLSAVDVGIIVGAILEVVQPVAASALAFAGAVLSGEPEVPRVRESWDCSAFERFAVVSCHPFVHQAFHP